MECSYSSPDSNVCLRDTRVKRESPPRSSPTRLTGSDVSPTGEHAWQKYQCLYFGALLLLHLIEFRRRHIREFRRGQIGRTHKLMNEIGADTFWNAAVRKNRWCAATDLRAAVHIDYVGSP